MTRISSRSFVWLAALGALAASSLCAQAPEQAWIASLDGTISVRRAGQEARPLGIRDAVQIGDELITGENSEAVIQTSSGHTVEIHPDSRVVLQSQPDSIGEFLHLFLGSVKVHIEKLTGRAGSHRMTTPTAVIAVRGTTFSVFVDEDEATFVVVTEGVVTVANIETPSVEVIVRRGERTWVRRGFPPIRAQAFQGPAERAHMLPGLVEGRGRAAEALANRGSRTGLGPPERIPPVAIPLAAPIDPPGLGRKPGPPL